MDEKSPHRFSTSVFVLFSPGKWVNRLTFPDLCSIWSATSGIGGVTKSRRTGFTFVKPFYLCRPLRTRGSR